MIDLDTKPQEPIQIEIDKSVGRTVIRYTGSEDGFYTAASVTRSISQPRDTTADMMVRIIAILSTLVGILYLSHGYFTTQPGTPHETIRDRALSEIQ